jgi:hypothetical protein
MKQKIFLAVSLLLMMNVLGQQKSKIKFHSINNAGVIVGGSDEALQLQTINGIKYKTYSAGIGIGLDDYYRKTIPLFLDLRKNLKDKKTSFFIYGDIGINFPWKKDDAENTWWSKGQFSKGLFFDAGLGYSLKICNWTSLLFSLGYSDKQLNEEKNLYPGIDIMPYPEPEQYKYTFRRINLKIGLSF